MENNILHEHYAFIVDNGQSPTRIDKYLMNFIENTTRNKIQSAVKKGCVIVNGKNVKSNYNVKPNDNIKVVFDYPPSENLIIAEDIALNIVYEDDDLLVIDKPAGLVVHPGHGNYSGTLVNGLVYHFENLPLNNTSRPGLVHRLDKDTSGLLVVAKNDAAMVSLSSQFAEKKTSREYFALVWGDVKNEKKKIINHIGRNPKNRLQNIVFDAENENLGKLAITNYELVESLGYVSLIKCKL